MVAELRDETAPLPLIFEPDRPEPHGRAQGWRRTRYESQSDESGLFRNHADDEFGARVQHAIAMYVFGAGRRAAIASRLGVSETSFQYMARGAMWGSYGRPVLRALRRLGITPGRGDWQGGIRPREIIAANQSVMRRALDALEGAPATPSERSHLITDLYLLTIASKEQTS